MRSKNAICCAVRPPNSYGGSRGIVLDVGFGSWEFKSNKKTKLFLSLECFLAMSDDKFCKFDLLFVLALLRVKTLKWGNEGG